MTRPKSIEGPTAQAAPASASLRDWRIDFWRGLAIVFILWNHSVDNVMSWFTTKYYGLSDSAELFVFLSGYAMAMMFLAKFLTRPVMALPYAVMRAFTLYIHHITAFIVIATIASVYRGWAGSSVMERDLFIRPFFVATETVMPKLATLAYLPPLLDILPLYILLTLLVGVLFFLFRDRWQLYVAFAIPVWLFAWTTGVNFSSYPDTRLWSFNPLSWQAVFLAGFATCLARDQPWLKRIATSPITLAWSITVIVVCFIAAGPWATAGLMDWRVPFLPNYADKMYASPIRLIHFLALAHVATLLVKKDNRLGSSIFGRSMILIGRRSLPLFVIATVFSAASHGAFDWFGRSLPVQLVYTLGMAGILVALAYIADEVGKATRGGGAPSPAPKAESRALPDRREMAGRSAPAE